MRVGGWLLHKPPHDHRAQHCACKQAELYHAKRVFGGVWRRRDAEFLGVGMGHMKSTVPLAEASAKLAGAATILEEQEVGVRVSR